jgi:calcineurin-like phosphoesterase family protein
MIKKDTIQLYEKYGTYLGQLDEIEINKQYIVLCHYSMNVWNRSHHGSWHLFGHSHGGLTDNPNSLSIDVGINCHNYYPIEFEEIKNKMKLKNNK